MAHKQHIAFTLACLLMAPSLTEAVAPRESSNQQLINAVMGHETHFGGMIFVDEYSSLPPAEAEAKRQKLVLLEVQAALLAGASPDAKAGPQESGEPVLIVAAQRGYIDVVELLLSKGANVRATDEYGNTILQELSAPSILLVQMLVAKGADINNDTKNVSPFRKFIISGNTPIVQFLLAHGADVNIRNSNGDTPLMDAAQWCRLDIIKLLLSYGADIHTRDSDLSTALTWAAIGHDNTDVLQFLIEKGVPVNEMPKAGLYNTPLHVAAFYGSVSNLKMLIAQGANTRARDFRGQTVMMYAERVLQDRGFSEDRRKSCAEVIILLKATGVKE